MSATATATTDSTTPASTDAQPTPVHATEPNGGTPADERRFSQADVNRIVDERLQRERQRAEREREQAETAAREAQLAEQQRFQQLAEQRGERIVELESQVARIETLTSERDAALEVVRALVEQEIASAPDYVRDAISDRSPVAQLQYLTQHRDKWARSTPRGASETPRPATSFVDEAAQRMAADARARMRRDF